MTGPDGAALTLTDVAALDALAQAARGCTACALRRGCTQVVVADGSPAAPLLVVGEAPGGEEDRLGLPFMGPAGQLLDRILAAVGLSRQDACLVNVVQCRPPGDRAPAPAEAAACLDLWLRPRIALMRPRVILSLGNTATQALLDTRQGITQLRGRWQTYPYGDAPDRAGRAWLLPMFHPAYLLRQDSRAPGSPRSLTWRDIQEAAAVLRGEKEPAADTAGSPPSLF